MCGYFCIRFNDFMLPGKTLTQFTNLFSPNGFKKNDEIVLNYFIKQCLKMNECNSRNIYPNISTRPSNDQQFRLNKINEIKDCFIAEIKERERTNEQKT